ncbi:MAG: ribosome biogenesis factor YjgA [Comamonas sp.]
MSRKPKKGYFVRGQFVAEGSELDLELKREMKGDTDASRTDLKRESEELQKLGAELLTLRAGLFKRLDLPEKLADALAEAKRITNFEGKRRQMQFVGKLMRKLEEAQVQAIRDALEEQRVGSAQDNLRLHLAEQWRDALIADDEALQRWLAEHPDTDIQALRALIRQARKDAAAQAATPPAPAKGETPRHGRAYREIFQQVQAALRAADGADADDEDGNDPEDAQA